jgi:DNA-3-methyladenine glycosylase II
VQSCWIIRALHQTVEFPPPLDIHGSLELFRRSGDDLVDRWDGSRLARVLRIGDNHAAFAATPDGTLGTPALRFTTHSDQHHEAVRNAVADTFVLAPAAYADLLELDPVLGRLDALYPGIRQIRQLDLFTALIRCISAQQVNLRWAVTTRRRLAETFGQRHAIDGHVVYSLDPEPIASAAWEQIRALQFTTTKSKSIVAAAQALVDGQVTLDELRHLPDQEVIARLITIRGIGLWSAEWVLARTLGRPRVVAGDLGVRKAVGMAYLGGALPSEAQVRAATAHWGASAGTAQALLLHALGEHALIQGPP